MTKMTKDNAMEEFLQAPSSITSEPQYLTRLQSPYRPLNTFTLPTGEHKHYTQQYADMYFARLAQLKPAVESMADSAWTGLSIGGEEVRRVDRVLDVRQGQLCWVVGTVFMDMPLKPCILDDISKEHWIAAPPAREKFISMSEDGTATGSTQVMLEDESGRLRLIGPVLDSHLIVTGCIIAVLGTENKDGDFEVLYIQGPDLAPQPSRSVPSSNGTSGRASSGPKPAKPSSTPSSPAGKVAIVSGLAIGATEGDTLPLDLMLEYLLGESSSSSSQLESSRITRLIIAGNSLSSSNPIPSRAEVAARKAASSSSSSSTAGSTSGSAAAPEKKYGYDASAYNSGPTDRLDAFLSALLPSMPITLVPGDTDPTHTALPQPPIHAALFPQSRKYMRPPGLSSQGSKALNPASSTGGPDGPEADAVGWLDSTTNPTSFTLSAAGAGAETGELQFLITGGQNLNDMYKYLPGDNRLDMLEAQLQWRLIAPTAPDTLWCYPFQDGDRFVIRESPAVYIVGDQGRFDTRVVRRDGEQDKERDGDGEETAKEQGKDETQVRVIMVPRFKDTGEMVVLDLETLVPEVVRFKVGG